MICCTFDVDVWAFDSDAVKALKDMKPMDMEKLVAKYSILLDPDSELLPQNRPNTLVSIQEKASLIQRNRFLIQENLRDCLIPDNGLI